MRELHIAYRYGEHYDSVRRINDNSEAPAHLQTDVSKASVPFCSLSSAGTRARAGCPQLKTIGVFVTLALTVCELDFFFLKILFIYF